MGSFRHPRVFDPLDLEIIDRVCEAAWAQLEAACHVAASPAPEKSHLGELR